MTYKIEAFEPSTKLTCFYVELKLKTTVDKLQYSPYFLTKDKWEIFPKTRKERKKYIDILLNSSDLETKILGKMEPFKIVKNKNYKMTIDDSKSVCGKCKNVLPTEDFVNERGITRKCCRMCLEKKRGGPLVDKAGPPINSTKCGKCRRFLPPENFINDRKKVTKTCVSCLQRLMDQRISKMDKLEN
jgi:hypothetical protein